MRTGSASAGAVVLDRGDQLDEILGTLRVGGMKMQKLAVARLDRQRRPDRAQLLPRRAGAGSARVPSAAARRVRRQGGVRGERIERHDVASSGGTQGSEPSGRRKPTGESPGIRNSCRAGLQRSLRQRRAACLPALDRQDVAGGDVEAALEHLGQPRALLGSSSLLSAVEVGRQRCSLAGSARILVGRHRVVGVEVEPLGQPAREALGVVGVGGPSGLVLATISAGLRHNGRPSPRQ